jgi:hypothetical protein
MAIVVTPTGSEISDFRKLCFLHWRVRHIGRRLDNVHFSWGDQVILDISLEDTSRELNRIVGEIANRTGIPNKATTDRCLSIRAEIGKARRKLTFGAE